MHEPIIGGIYTTKEGSISICLHCKILVKNKINVDLAVFKPSIARKLTIGNLYNYKTETIPIYQCEFINLTSEVLIKHFLGEGYCGCVDPILLNELLEEHYKSVITGRNIMR